MTHWIIKDYGITGRNYECANCHAVFTYPLHRFVAIVKRCPECDEYIDPNYEEYEWSLNYD